MGIGDFDNVTLNNGEQHYRQYPAHEADDTLESYVDEIQESFPEEVRVDFIEVSPEMTKHRGMAYSRFKKGRRHQYIRMSKRFVENESDYEVYLTVAHEMCHLYLYQNGYRGSNDISEKNPVFSWILGRVGASISGVETSSDEWDDLIEPFLQM